MNPALSIPKQVLSKRENAPKKLKTSVINLFCLLFQKISVWTPEKMAAHLNTKGLKLLRRMRGNILSFPLKSQANNKIVFIQCKFKINTIEDLQIYAKKPKTARIGPNLFPMDTVYL